MSVDGVKSARVENIQKLHDYQTEFKRRAEQLKKEGERQVESQKESNESKLNHVKLQQEQKLTELQRDSEKTIQGIEKDHEEKVELTRDMKKYREAQLREQAQKQLQDLETAAKEKIHQRQKMIDQIQKQKEKLTHSKNEELKKVDINSQKQVNESRETWAERMSNLAQAADKQIRTIKEDSEKEIEGLKKRNRERVNEQREMNEENVGKLYKRNETTEKTLNRAQKALMEYNQSQKDNAQLNLEKTLSAQREDADRALQNSAIQTEKAVRTVKSKSADEMNDLRFRLKQQRLKEAKNIMEAHTNQTANEMASLRNRKNMFKDSVDKMDFDHREQVRKLQGAFTNQFKSLNDHNQESIKQLQGTHEERMKRFKEVAENNYKTNMEKSNHSLDLLKNKMSEEENNLIRDAAIKFEAADRKTEDNFYQLQKLDGKLSENTDAYKIKLEIPEYEAKNLSIRLGRRHAELFVSREFKDSQENQITGESFSTNNYQTLKQRIALGQEIDPKKMSKKYEDGIMTITIPFKKVFKA